MLLLSIVIVLVEKEEMEGELVEEDDSFVSYLHLR